MYFRGAGTLFSLPAHQGLPVVYMSKKKLIPSSRINLHPAPQVGASNERLHHQEIMLQGCGLPELKRLIRSEQTQKHRGIVMTSKQVISNADFPPVCRTPSDKIYHLLLICFKAIEMVLMFSSILSFFYALASAMMAGVSPAKIHTEQVAQCRNYPHTLHCSVKGFPFPISLG